MSDYEYTIEDGEATITSYKGDGGAVIVPDTLDGFPVTAIGFAAFQLHQCLSRVILPNSLVTIWGHAFSGCYGLTSVILQENLVTIGHHAFFACHALDRVIVPASVTHIGVGAFPGALCLRGASGYAPPVREAKTSGFARLRAFVKVKRKIRLGGSGNSLNPSPADSGMRRVNDV